MTNNKKVCIAIVKSTHGYKGDLKMKIFLEDIDLFNNFKEIFDENGNLVNLKLKSIMPKSSAIVSHESLNNKEDAAKLQGQKFYCSLSELPKIDNDDEFYYDELIGLKVLQNNEEIGHVSMVANYGAKDLLDIKMNDDSTETIEFTKENILEVNIEKSYLTISKPEPNI